MYILHKSGGSATSEFCYVTIPFLAGKMLTECTPCFIYCRTPKTGHQRQNVSMQIRRPWLHLPSYTYHSRVKYLVQYVLMYTATISRVECGYN